MSVEELHYNQIQKYRQNYTDYKFIINAVKQMNDLTAYDDYI